MRAIRLPAKRVSLQRVGLRRVVRRFGISGIPLFKRGIW